MRLLVSLMCAMVCVSPIILVTGKPYSSKRLSYGESMDWNFGGWTPVGGGGGGSLGSERQLKSHHSLFDSSSFRGSEFASILTPVPSSPSSFQSFPSSASLKHSPSSSSSHSSSSHSLALQHLTPMMTTSRLHQQQRHHLLHQEEDSPESMIMSGKQQQASSSSPTASPSMTRAYRFLDSISNNGHNNNIPASPAAALRNQVPKPYLGPSNQAAPAGHATVHYPSSPLDKESAANLLSDVHPGIKMEAKPLREAQIEAYKVIEQLEAQQEHLNSVSQSGKASLLPSGLPDGQTGGEAQSYSAMHPMPMPGYQVSGGYGKPSLQSMDSYSLMPSRKQTTGKNPFNPYTLLNNLVGSKNYSPQQQQQQQNSESKTIGLPVKEITNDYVTLPVAVETDADKVLTQADIREIEQEVLKAIPETLGSYGDKLPDNLYEQALQIDPSHGSNGPKYETIELPPSVLMHGQQQGRQLYGGNQQQHKQSNPFLNGFMHNVRMPGFISALSPSKAKISDILKPLLRKVRPPLPASPAQQLKEGPTDVPNIPGNAPYAGSHRPENLDVVHFIAHQSGNPQSGGSSGGGGEPVVYHVNQLMRTPPRSFPRGNKNKKRRKNGNNNNVNFPPPQAYQQMHYASQYGNGNDMTSSNNGNTRNQYSSLIPDRTPIPFGPQEQALLHAMTQPLGPQPQNPQSNDQVTYEIVQEPPSAATRPPPLDPYMTGYTARPPIFPPSYGQTFDLPQPQQQQQQYQQQPQAPPQQQQTIMVPPPQSYTRPSSLPPAPVQYQQQEEQLQQQLQQQSYGPQNQQPNHQQSQPNSNNNPYIEVVNLPSGGGGQSVHYNPPPAQYLPPPQEQQQQPEYQIQTNGQQYDQQQQQQQNNYASAQSYENEMKGGSGQQLNGQGVSMEYIDPQPVFSPAALDSYSGHQQQQQQQQSQSGRKEKEVVTLNNYKQTVSSLDPKTLVELIAKQVPSLKDVLTGGGQESGSGYGQQQQQQDSRPKDTSYEIIEMPPKYHSDANEYSPNAGGPPPPSDGGYSMGQSDGSNGGSGGVQQESYFIRHTSEQQDGNNNNNYGNSNPHDAEYAAASSESAEAHPGSHAAHESGKAESGSGPQEDQESHPTALSSLRHQESGSASPSDPLSPSPASNEDDAGEDQDNKYNNEMSDTPTASGPLDRVPDDSRQGAQQQQEPLLIRNTDRYDGLDSLSSSSPSSSSSSSGVKRLKDKKRTPYFGSSSYGQRIRGSESSHSPSYSVSSSSQSSSSSSSSSSEAAAKEPESGSAGEKGVKIKATVEVSKIPVSDFTSILLDQHVTQKSKLAKKSTHNNNNSRQHHHQDDEDTGSDSRSDSDHSRHQDHEVRKSEGEEGEGKKSNGPSDSLSC